MMSNYLQLVCITLAGTSLAATVAVEARSVLMIAAEEKCMMAYINVRTVVSKWLAGSTRYLCLAEQSASTIQEWRD
jgi:hypothetical protein